MNWQNGSSRLLREVKEIKMNKSTQMSVIQTDRCSSAYRLDNSAIIHLAAKRKSYTNTFRIVVQIKEPVCPGVLQDALNHITPRFPTIIAGIRKGAFQYKVVPVKTPPKAVREQGCLVPMTAEELENCAFRVLYGEYRIAVEIFHSLTDGYGGMVVISSLVAEYLRRAYSLYIPVDGILADTESECVQEELTDDYFTYSGKKAAVPKHRNVYQLPSGVALGPNTLTRTQKYDVDMILQTAHRYGVSTTAFLTAVMAESVMEIQQKHCRDEQDKKPIQIMIPVNLRRLFNSQTLRNFSLYALTYIGLEKKRPEFSKLAESISDQLKKQVTSEHMAAEMATHTKGETFFLYRILPLPIKWLLLRAGHMIFGESNSCISISNLGVISLPMEMTDYVEGIDFILTPRIRSPYNCGVVSFNGKISVSFSRHCPEPELEDVFFAKLENLIR